MTTPDPHSHDTQLDALVARYIEAIERSETPDREKLIADNPALANGLRRFFTDYDRLQLTNLQPAAHQVNPEATFIPQHEPQPGTIFGGRYKLLQNIGEGGMGSVWVAEQKEPVKRKVAIKLVKAGMDSKQVLARFEAERQALAMMDHPNIAKVFDGGITEHGRPYFVMEYVKGVPFTEYCDKARLSLKERLNLFIPVCQAVQHAHHKGIVHRDLKPSNILICLYDGKPVPKVIDFGLAKAMHQQLTEQSIFTAHGVMVGTPVYMSPEQAEHNNLDIDTRTDIYSLGVVLYELLTGTTPLERELLRTAAHQEVLRLIKEVEPPRPSTRLSGSDSLPSIAAQRNIDPRHLQKSVAGDLDWIVMKSLEKERSRRYETASGFVRDIERFLNDEAVEACPPSLTYRLRKFVKKHKAQVIVAGALLLSLIAGIIGTSWGLAQARLAKNAAIASEQKAVASEQKTIDALQQVTRERDAKDEQRKLAEAAEAQTLAIFRDSTDDSIQELISSKPQVGSKERAYLEKTLERWQLFADREGDDERSMEYRAEGHFRLGSVWQHLGETSAARAAYEQAININQKLVSQFSAVPEYQNDLASSHLNLGNLLMDLGDTAAARAAYEQARDIRQKLVTQFPAIREYQNGLATSHNNLGLLLMGLGDTAAARAALEQARDVQQKLVTEFPVVRTYKKDLAKHHNNLGALLKSLGETSAARAAYEQAHDINQKLVKEFPAVPEYQDDLASSHLSLGNLLMDLGDIVAAQAAYEQARDIQQQLVTQFPAVPEYQNALATSHNNLSKLLMDLGEASAARAAIEQARDIQQKLVTQFPAVPEYQKDLAGSHNNLGILLMDLGETSAARAAYAQALDIRQQLVTQFPAVPEYRTNLGGYYCNFGTLVRGAGQSAESLGYYTQAIEILSSGFPTGYSDVTTTQFLHNSYFGRALAHTQLGRHAEATADWDQAIAFSPAHKDPADRIARAEARMRAGQWTTAVAELDELLQLTEKGGNVAPQWSASGWYQFAYLYSLASGQPGDKQTAYADRAMQLLKKAVTAGDNTPEAVFYMATNPDLNPLRERDDFKQLLESLPQVSEPASDPSPPADATPPQP